MSAEEGPDRKITAEIPQAEIVAGLLAKIQQAVTEGFAAQAAVNEEIRGDVSTMKNTLRTVVDQAHETAQKVANIEGWREGLMPRVQAHSDRVREASSVNEAQTVQLEAEKKAREELALKVDENTKKTEEARAAAEAVKVAMTNPKTNAMIVYEDLKKSPHTPRIIGALVALLLAAMGYATMTLKNLEQKVEHPPAQVHQ